MTRRKKPAIDDSGLRTEDSALGGEDESLPGDPRTRARWLAVQALYEWDTSGHDALEALGHRLADRPAKKSAESFARELVSGVGERLPEIDAVMRRAAPQWPPEQMAVVDRNIIRVAIYEVLFDNKTPVRAALNEAVELAKTFGGESSPRFVNGVLGGVASMATR
jgi:N utilization substance protein B